MSDTAERSEEENASDFLVESEEEKLAECFKDVYAFLTGNEYWQYFGNRLKTRYKNIEEELTSKLKDLQQIDCGIVIAGETSAGKTTLINRILGRNLLLSDPMETTTKIYRLQYAETYQMKIYRDNVISNKMVFDSPEKLQQKLMELEDEERRDESITQVDVMLPFVQLKGNITIVDTPGIGDKQKLIQVLKDYIPKAVAFVFVVDASRAGGLQDDRILKIFREVRSNMDSMHCLDPRDVLFLINKWDCVEATEERKHQMELKLRKKIEEEWQWTQPKNVFNTSLKKREEKESIYLPEYGRFETALLSLIQKKKNIRIKQHTLYLAELVANAKCYVEWEEGKRNRSREENLRISNETKEMMHQISKDMRKMEKNRDENVQRILHTLTGELQKYINSADFKELILRSEPSLTSMYRVMISREIGKRITKQTQSWMLENIPNILEKEISDVFVADAEKINDNIQTLKSVIKNRSDRVLTKALIWTVATGLYWLFNRAFWGFVFGPVVGLIFGFATAFFVILGGIADIVELIQEPQEIVTRSFTRRITRLDEEAISKAIKEKFEKYLENVSDIISQKLWMEIEDLTSEIEALGADCNQQEEICEHIDYLLKKFEVLEEQIQEINIFSSKHE